MNRAIFYIGSSRWEIKQGDISTEPAEAIVNAANGKMVMGGGVAAAIKKKGGSIIEREARKKAPVPLGDVAVTGGGSLACRYVIHAVTVDSSGTSSQEIIRLATQNTLKSAEKLKISSLAFPALGCGAGGVSVGQVATVMVEEVLRHTACFSYPSKLFFVLWSEQDFNTFLEAAEPLLAQLSRKAFRNPLPTVDIIIEVAGGIVLVERKNYPAGWALPGGFVDYGESLEEAAVREAREETGLQLTNLKQFHTYSRPGRDPRFHTIATVFTASSTGTPKAGDDAAAIGIFSRQNLPGTLAFDHGSILNDYFAWRKKDTNSDAE